MMTIHNILATLRTCIILCAISLIFISPNNAFAQKAPTQPYTLGPATPENNLIKLRYAMETAITVKEKKNILEKIGETGTFQGMMYAAQYLNEKDLKKAAAKSVFKIARLNPDYNGKLVLDILLQASNTLKGKQHKEIMRHINLCNKSEIGFLSLFNGKDLSGWKGLVENPIKRAAMSVDELAAKQAKADENMHKDWAVVDGLLCYIGKGYDNLCSEEKYKDFEMYVDWCLDPNGREPDAGIYLRGTPQVQIWDTARVNVGAQVGSGGLYNNKKYQSKPSEVADNKVGIWNSFYIKMIGDKVTVKLNGVTVVDNVILENYWKRDWEIFPEEQIELQAHGSRVYYRDIYIKRL